MRERQTALHPGRPRNASAPARKRRTVVGADERVQPGADPSDCAKAAGLRYLNDATPGIRRKRIGRHFTYRYPDGTTVRDADALRRIRSLVIPPAWTDVWIAPVADAHMQVTARDARGRKQYRYHARWREIRDESKYGRMLAFGQALPAMRERVSEDLGRRGLPREKVLATVVRLLETTLVRVGNEEYARDNNSFGLTTLRDDHAEISGSQVLFTFRGKSGKEHCVGVQDARLARIVRKSQELPGEELFQYIADDGKQCTIGSSDVNEYLREISGQDFTAKDFRTWSGTVLAAVALGERPEFASEAEAKRNVAQAIASVAEKLGNTPAVCRKSYVHPAIIDAYMDGTLIPALRAHDEDPPGYELRDGEAAVLELLGKRPGC